MVLFNIQPKEKWDRYLGIFCLVLRVLESEIWLLSPEFSESFHCCREKRAVNLSEHFRSLPNFFHILELQGYCL